MWAGLHQRNHNQLTWFHLAWYLLVTLGLSGENPPSHYVGNLPCLMLSVCHDRATRVFLWPISSRDHTRSVQTSSEQCGAHPALLVSALSALSAFHLVLQVFAFNVTLACSSSPFCLCLDYNIDPPSILHFKPRLPYIPSSKHSELLLLSFSFQSLLCYHR